MKDEQQIIELINSECRPRKGYLWGQESDIEPQLVSTIFGDGRHIIGIQTCDSRPDYYVLRIDSKTCLDDDFDPEPYLDAISDDFGDVADYDEEYINGEYKVKYSGDDAAEWEDWSVTDFPMLSTGNGYWWWTIENLGSK